MIIDKAAQSAEPAHRIELKCNHCNHDVTEQEIVALQCNECGGSLSVLKQNVAIEVVLPPLFG